MRVATPQRTLPISSHVRPTFLDGSTEIEVANHVLTIHGPHTTKSPPDAKRLK